MGRLKKRTKQLQDAREVKRQRRSDTIDMDLLTDIFHEAHWEGLSNSEEESDIEISESEDNIPDGGKDAFERLLSAAQTSETTKFPYQREPTLSKRQQYRVRAKERDLAQAARTHSQPLSRFFSSTLPTPNKESAVASEPQDRLRREAIEDLEKKLRSKKTRLEGQNLTRHRAVLALLYTTQSRQGGDTREDLSYHVARAFNKGVYFSRKVVEWENMWIRERKIPEGKQGCFGKTSSWFNDEGVQIAVREWCAGAGESKFFRYFKLYANHKYRTNMFNYRNYGIWSSKGSWKISRLPSCDNYHQRIASGCLSAIIISGTYTIESSYSRPHSTPLVKEDGLCV